MTLTRLLRRNLRFHWRGNVAVLLGVAVGTAVLTGALLVGDSLRGSLRARALRQLGDVEYALTANRFFRDSIAQNLQSEGVTVHAGLMLRGAASAGDRRVNGVTVMDTGTARVFFDNPRYERPEMPPWRPWHLIPGLRPAPTYLKTGILAGIEVHPSVAVADQLGIDAPGTIRLHLQKGNAIPRESLLGRRNTADATQSFDLEVRWVRGDDAATFTLRPGAGEVRNVYVDNDVLQKSADLHGRANMILVHGGDLAALNDRLRSALTLDDWGLIVRQPTERVSTLFARLDRNNNGTLSQAEWRNGLAETTVEAADANNDRALSKEELLVYYRQRGVLSLESKSLLIEPAVERAALEAAATVGLRAAPTLVYLANSIGDGKEAIPYSVVAALDAKLPAPLGPFLPAVADASGSELRDDEIVLVDWPASPLKVKPGDAVTLTFFDPEQEGRIKETTATFRLRGLVPLTGPAADPDLTPEFPGITDKLGLRDWDPPFPDYDPSRIRARDDEFWRQHRGTPKAYISLAAGRKHFGSRFGEATSIRLAPPAGRDPDLAAAAFAEELRRRLRPEWGGFVFEDVRSRALEASTGGQDFGLLFLGFSFFLIAAALVLVGLLVRLNLDRRASEVGLLLASGYRVSTVRRLLLTEGMVVAVVGALVGLAGAIGYADLMLRLLAALWPAGAIGSFLELHVTGTSLAIGFAAALVISGLTIWSAVRVLRKVAPSALIAGVTQPDVPGGADKPGRWRRVLLVGGLVLGIILIASGSFVRNAEARAGTFFGGGALLLTAALTAVWAWMKAPRRTAIAPGATFAVARLGGRNAVRNPTRSLLTAALLASAAFLLVAVESFRRAPEADFLERHGGSGGFALLAESDLPLYQDPNAGPGRQELLDKLEQRYQRLPGATPADTKGKLDAAVKLLDQTTIVPLRVSAGDDASCLNLYQPGKPRLVGVPRPLAARGGFHFAGTQSPTDGVSDNPWSLLDHATDDGTIPVFGEAHTVQWMLKKGLGDTIEVPDESGRPVQLRIVGLLKDSVFQSELLMSEANFLKLYPRQEGYSTLLIDAPRGREAEVRDLLGAALTDRGFDISFAKDRLAAYLAVENTYLSTFQVLGGFGLLLGALGLAVVLLRGIWERRGELALLRALGYRHRALGGMVFAENALLLLIGLGAGVGAALLSVAPHVVTGEGSVPWLRLAGLLGLVVVAGLCAGALAVRSTLRAPLVPALRRE